MTISNLGYVVLTALTILALWPLGNSRPAAWWNGRGAFAGLLLLTIMVAYAPALDRREELLNPDESQLIAGALTLRGHFAPWLSVDLSTAGPVSVLPLLLTPANYVSARWLAALLVAAAVVFCWLALTSTGDDALTRVAALPVATFFAFMQDTELFQYSTEHVAALLLAIAVWLWMSATAGGENPLKRGPALGLGVCVGAAVMAKLQSAPGAAWLALAPGGLALLDSRLAWSRRLTVFACLMAGTACVPVFFIVLAAAQGALPDLVQSYVLNNLHYVGSMKHERTGILGYQPAVVWGLNYLLKPVGILMLACLAAGRKFSGAERRIAIVSLGLLVASIAAVALPGLGSRHYWFFVLGPVVLAFGSVACPAWRCLRARLPGSAARQRWVIAGLVPLLLCLPVAHRLRTNRDEALAGVLTQIPTVVGAGQKLHELARPGDKLTVWGWRSELYVYSGLPQGTREAHTEWLIEAIPLRDYYRQRFLGDFMRVQPRFFADAVGTGSFTYPDRAKAGHETFAALRELINRDYDYIGEIDTVRIYTRHGR
jgi:hypothetical protein